MYDLNGIKWIIDEVIIIDNIPKALISLNTMWEKSHE